MNYLVSKFWHCGKPEMFICLFVFFFLRQGFLCNGSSCSRIHCRDRTVRELTVSNQCVEILTLTLWIWFYLDIQTLPVMGSRDMVQWIRTCSKTQGTEFKSQHSHKSQEWLCASVFSKLEMGEILQILEFLVSQPSENCEPQIWWETLSHREMWGAIAEDTWCRPLASTRGLNSWTRVHTFVYTWHNFSLENVPTRLACGVFSWLMINVGGSSSLWSVSSRAGSPELHKNARWASKPVNGTPPWPLPWLPSVVSC